MRAIAILLLIAPVATSPDRDFTMQAPPGHPQVFSPQVASQDGPTPFCVRPDRESNPQMNHYFCYGGELVRQIIKTQSGAYLRAVADEIDAQPLPIERKGAKRPA